METHRRTALQPHVGPSFYLSENNTQSTEKLQGTTEEKGTYTKTTNEEKDTMDLTTLRILKTSVPQKASCSLKRSQTVGNHIS